MNEFVVITINPQWIDTQLLSGESVVGLVGLVSQW